MKTAHPIPPLGTLVAATFTHFKADHHYIGSLVHVVPAGVAPSDEEVDNYFLAGMDRMVAEEARASLSRPRRYAAWVLKPHSAGPRYTIIVPDSPHWTLHQVLQGRPNTERK